MRYEQKINVFFKQFDQEFTTIIPNVVAETATEFFKDRFRTQEWEGIPWPALSPLYASRKTRGRGRILTRTGLLMNSIHPAVVTDERVVISAGNSRVPYARIHNEGLRVQGIQNVRAHSKNNFMGKGKKVQISAHNRRVDFVMPQRQFMGNSPRLNQMIKDRLIAAYNNR